MESLNIEEDEIVSFLMEESARNGVVTSVACEVALALERCKSATMMTSLLETGSVRPRGQGAPPRGVVVASRVLNAASFPPLPVAVEPPATVNPPATVDPPPPLDSGSFSLPFAGFVPPLVPGTEGVAPI